MLQITRMAAEEGKSEEGGKKSRRLSGEPPLQEDLHFPPLVKFNPPNKLPTNACIIGRKRNLSGGGKNNMSSNKAAVEVAKEVESKYFHDTIYSTERTWVGGRLWRRSGV